MRQILFIYFAFISLFAFAQVPTVDPTATYYMINDEGEEETDVIANEKVKIVKYCINPPSVRAMKILSTI